MKFKKLSIIIFLLTILVVFGLAANAKGYLEVISAPTISETIKNDVIIKDPTKEYSIAFSVLGDVHGNTLKLEAALVDLNHVNSNMDAVILNGDNVDEGLENQYDSLKKCLDKNTSILPKTIIKNIGNHDFFDYEKGPNSQSDVNDFINRYLQFSKEKSVYHDTWIRGYHFISLGSESGNTKDLGTVKAFISEKQQKWLEDKLSEKYEAGKPIFVFIHQHITSTMKGWGGVEQREEINKILSKYPEVILFTSHTHLSLQIDSVRLKQPYTMAHTGAVSYVILPNSEGGIQRLQGESQGLYVEVYKNKVIIKGRDFARKSWIFSKEI